MDDLQVSFTITTDAGTTAFNTISELEQPLQRHLLNRLKLIMQTAAEALLAQLIGSEEAEKYVVVVSE
ncbi:hypothetical protein [Paenibacillus abyssi]|uniref:Uncharacterized protein n=1 Tax=Paenibacillus abyssi TaxID=1340531 RepID=A0A917G487_9BACL|nr:hypothetical protein [Paenibacillus abyssi]GGG22170.1 hypothetical protein GCM10010916_43520 [Paenibacillus abyssi]